MEKKIENKYNNLTPIKKISFNEKRKNWNWLFKCDCGSEKIINISQVRQNKTKSCGCLKRKNLKHGCGVKHNNWKGKTPIPKTYINSIIRRAKLKGYEYNISDEYLYNLYIKQSGKCKLSGIELSISLNNFTASLDRINSNIGYIENNLQWLHKDVNYIKYNLTIDELLLICEKIKHKHGI